MADNPLLTRTFPIPFDQVTPEHIEPAVEELLADARERMQVVIDETRPRTFDNTMLALEAITERLEHAMGIAGHLESVSTSETLRAAYNEAQPRVSEFFSRLALSAGLWSAVKAYAATEEAQALQGPRARFLRKTVAEFKRHGAGLDDEGKEKLAGIDVELSKLSLKYSQNVLDSTNRFELLVDDAQRLSGLPDSARMAARASAEAKDKEGWLLTLHAPSYIPVLRYLDDASIREKVYRALSTRATESELDNRPVLARMIALRNEKARLLGYATFADLVLEDRMAKTGDQARAFVDDLRQRTTKHFEREKAELESYRRELEGDDAATLRPWDLMYYSEKLRRARFDFDEEALRPYFSYERVLEGLFEIAKRLYGVRVEPWDEAPAWHQSVRTFKIIDDEDDRWLAAIHVDPFPRDEKQGGAWMNGILGRGQGESDTRQLGLMVANVTPSVGDRDAQLTHREVETMFHEFGHLMHHCLSSAALRSQAGTSVAWDFVELPSQIMENWCWEREALDLFAKHVDDDEPIPDTLLEPMQRARTFRAASMQMRQLALATTDLRLHIEYDAATDGDATSYARGVLQEFSATPLPDDYAMIASFSHLFGSPVGYAAGYYSYKWAEVLDADAFTRFKKEGLFNPEVGRAFRDRILAPGDEEDPALLYRDFMQREPDLDALMNRLGLQQPAC